MTFPFHLSSFFDSAVSGWKLEIFESNCKEALLAYGCICAEILGKGNQRRNHYLVRVFQLKKILFDFPKVSMKITNHRLTWANVFAAGSFSSVREIRTLAMVSFNASTCSGSQKGNSGVRRM